jgi:hypothetical protein
VKRFSLLTLLLVMTMVSFALALWVDRHNRGALPTYQINVKDGTATVITE